MRGIPPLGEAVVNPTRLVLITGKFVGYGGCGAARAVEQLRLILSELQLATLRHTIHINRIELVGMLMHGKTFADYSYLEGSIAAMLNDLVWWACVLKAGRNRET
jgi:NAD(P)H-dependent FMN reductase